MYSSLEELPTQVLMSLDRRDAAKWMDIYNATLGSDKGKASVRKARTAAWKAVLTAPSALSFNIIASADVTDRDKEKIVLDSICKYMDGFIDQGGQVQNWHRNYNIATVWDWYRTKTKDRDGKEVDAVGVWGNMFGGSPVYERARMDFLGGNNSMSVAGLATPKGFKCDESGCFLEREMTQIMEISLCPVPSNPLATLRWHSRMDGDVAKSDDAPVVGEIRLDVTGMKVHKDHTLCPIQALKKAFLDDGYTDVHARPWGVYLGGLDGPSREAETGRLKAEGWYVVPVDGGLMVNRFDDMLRAAFKDCYEAGEVDREGYFLDMGRDRFKELYDLGLYRNENGRFRMAAPSVPLNTYEAVSKQ